MGIFDKIRDSVYRDDEDFDYDDEYDDDDFSDERSRKGFSRKKEFDYESEASNEKIKSVKSGSQNKIKSVYAKKTSNGAEVRVFKPTRFEEASEVINTLLGGCTVVLNFEGLDVDVAQRIIDFASGACYAVDGNLQKISNYIVILTPKGTDILGEVQDILAGAFDVPSI